MPSPAMFAEPPQACWTRVATGLCSARQLPHRHPQQQKSCQSFPNSLILLWAGGLRSLAATLCFLASASQRIICAVSPILFFTLPGCSSSFQETVGHLKHHVHKLRYSTSKKTARSHPLGIQPVLLFCDLNCLFQTFPGRRVKYQPWMLLFKDTSLLILK